jgi:hypothetical protein
VQKDTNDALGVLILASQVDGRHEQAAGPEAFIERVQCHPAIAAELVECEGLARCQAFAVSR